MSTFTKEFLSESVNGKNTKVVATATPGTLIHTAVTGTGSKDEIWLFATNTSEGNVKLTVEWGGVTPDDLLIVTIAAQAGDVLIVAGKPMNNSLAIRAFASAANVINISGFVNRIV